MQGAYLGPGYGDDEIRTFLDETGCEYEYVADRAEWARKIAEYLASDNVVGLFNGRMEFGPRALGHRSILGDPRSPTMQSVMNLKIKYRESFRPFAPSVLRERVNKYFELDEESPYMLLVAPVQPDRRTPPAADRSDIRKWVNQVRSDLPAITHVDYTARVQTVDGVHCEDYYAVLRAFEALTGCGVVVNTSFNVRGEPIVCSPADAYRCFMRTEMDYLVLGRFILDKKGQTQEVRPVEEWQNEFPLD
jgi:carbamoyltransferase